MDVDYMRQIPITKDRYSYTKSRTTNIFDDILNDDIPSIVKRSYSKALEENLPIYTSPYTTTSPYRSPLLDDDISFKARPNTDYVVNRSYSQYGRLPRWNDSLEVITQFPEIRRERSPYTRERSPYTTPTIYSETHPTPSSYMPSYVPRSSLLLDRDPPKFDRYDPKPKSDRSKPYFLKPELPRYYPSQNKPEDASSRVSSRLNTSFPFRKYRSDFVPYAPYHNMYDSMKYSPNPDWVTMKPWGHRFRKARFVYVPEDKNSCMSMEIERVMREARMRELCKGIYSSSYGDDISSRVNLATGLLDSNSSSSNSGLQASARPRPQVKAAEAEIAPTQGEKERRKPMSLADKRKRNETLAVGLSRTELLKNDNESANTAPSKLSTSSLPPKEETPVQRCPTPPRRDPTPPPPKDPTPPPKEPTPPPPKEPTPPPPKEPTPPPPKEPTPPPPKEPTPPPREPSPSPKEPTPPPREPTPPPREPTPPPKEPTPPPREPTPPPKEPTPPPKEPTPPPKEPTPPLREPTPPPPKEATPPPPKEPTPPPREPTPPPKEPTPPSSKEPTPPLEKEPSPPPPTREPSPPAKESSPPPQDVTSSQEETDLEEEISPVGEPITSPPDEECNEVENIANNPSNETSNETENATNDPSNDDQLNGYMEENFQRTETGHYMVEEVDNGDGQIIRTEYIIEEIDLAK